ncbi:hypothetical protein [Rhodoblastus sp.]|uniref:hypothetical protein n=1 Tax=Rhodoblastus sp. TaxID=1962975 RepID=UPI0035B2CAB3
MSKTTVSASATGLPSRRLFLASGPAAAVLISLRKAAAEESPLSALIERHRVAYAEFNDACGFADFIEEGDPAFAAAAGKYERLNKVEDALMDELLAFPVKTLEDGRTKAAYLAQHFERGDPQHYQFDAFMRSFLV